MVNPLDYKITELNTLKPKSGRLLIAEPFMDDPYFKRTVVLLTGYDNNGAFGFILNKKIDVKLNDLIKDFPTFDAPVFMGGPVQTDNLFYLHTQGDHIDESIKISDNLYWSGNFNQLKNMIKNNEIFPDEIKFFLGYSGWDHQQLTDELKEESWLISNIQTNHLKDLNETDLWHNTLQKISEKHAVLSNFPENPSLN
ncbi:MAG: YqgE/AlgH family protein [Vicingaceae bacterium]